MLGNYYRELWESLTTRFASSPFVCLPAYLFELSVCYGLLGNWVIENFKEKKKTTTPQQQHESIRGLQASYRSVLFTAVLCNAHVENTALSIVMTIFEFFSVTAGGVTAIIWLKEQFEPQKYIMFQIFFKQVITTHIILSEESTLNN